VLMFGAAPVKTAVPVGSKPAGTSDLSQGAGDEKHRGISVRLHGRINADPDLWRMDCLANCRGDLTTKTRRYPGPDTQRAGAVRAWGKGVAREPALLCRFIRSGADRQCIAVTANTTMMAALREPMTASGMRSLRCFNTAPVLCVS
jgi:hypothetical protein